LQKDLDARLRSKSKRRLYAGLGTLWAAGGPLGFLLLRWLLAGAPLQPAWLVSEVRSQGITYAYLLLSTSTVLTMLGWWVGRRQDSVLELTRADPLTGLANRRQLFLRLQEELQRSARYRNAVSMLLMDVDRMKEINDTRGHRAGDLALLRVANILRSKCRSTDLPARCGGDEFAVIAPFASAQQARELALRVSRSLAALAPDEESGLEGPSVSIGIAAADGTQVLQADELYAAADRALYKAKAARGRGASFEPRIEATSTTIPNLGQS
jgi:diguanylate cyclase (GGDEF)-like protein